MIRLTRLNNKTIIVNAELVKMIETIPDTLLTLTDGDRLTVLEKPEQVVRHILDYRRYINTPLSPDQLHAAPRSE